MKNSRRTRKRAYKTKGEGCSRAFKRFSIKLVAERPVGQLFQSMLWILERDVVSKGSLNYCLEE